MYWSMIGLTHHHAPIDLRERLAFSSEQVGEALAQLANRFPGVEAVLLSTCNRVELYAASSDQGNLPAATQLGEFLAEFHNADFPSIEDQMTRLAGADAIKHLFMVASSLDSMIIGEAQILSQVKTAYEQACQTESASALMHQVFQRATSVAKRVASETDINRRRISVPSVAVSEVAADFFERFEDKQILLIGAGEMGTETLKYLIDAGANQVQVINRNAERAQELAESFKAQSVPWEQLQTAVAQADLIVSTTGAPQPILRADQIGKLGSRGSVLILDLAVPRDVEPAIGELPNVYLYTVDDLQAVCESNIAARRKEWPKAEKIVDSEVKRFLEEIAHRASGMTIKRLREQVENTKQTELERLLNKLKDKGLDDKAEKEITIAFDRVVNKLLHPPMQTLREHADSSNHGALLDYLRRLFRIQD
ncbi:MAG TPA: glutamyl-tRNA reductase [Planctomycetaceae bacterium]|nr:glutamyl-tRNA reductase [Planctomycetaceae bacterium]